MRKSRFTEAQNIGMIKLQEAGIPRASESWTARRTLLGAQ